MAADRIAASNNYLTLQQTINEDRKVSAQNILELSSKMDKFLERFESN